MTSEHLTVAIDGPSGSGKSSVSKAVARELGVGFLDTGAMYRALTWWCLEEGVDLDDQAAVAQAARELPLEMGHDPRVPQVRVSGREISQDIRTTRVSAVVSKVATNTDVRPVLQQRQRELMAQIAVETGGVVAEGRDITTVVAPDADVRILLTASEEARLRRRSRELHGHAEEHAVRPRRLDRVGVHRGSRRCGPRGHLGPGLRAERAGRPVGGALGAVTCVLKSARQWWLTSRR